MRNSIDTVFFDFDGTLVFHKPDSLDIIRAFCQEIGQPLTTEAERIIRRSRHEYFGDSAIRPSSDLSPQDFWQHLNRFLLEAAGIQGDLEQLAQKVTDHLAGIAFSYYCPEGNFRILTELRNRDYGLGLITNRENVNRFYELLHQMDLQSYFDLVLASGELGVRKPDPAIFHTALERTGAAAANSIYVGDNYWADIVGAERAGMAPVLLDPHRLFPEADSLILAELDELLAWLP